MYWLMILAAGVLETVWAVGLKASDGLTRPWISIGTHAIALVASMGLLAVALRHLPVGTAYVAWVGIGAVGTVIVGMLVLQEPMSVARMACVGLIIAGVVGLTWT